MIPAPLYRDPIYDGCSDPTVIRNEKTGKFYMFYTQRRANVRVEDVARCYATDIGVAESDNGEYWHYVGALDLEFEFGRNTFWAPEVIYNPDDGLYHMFVTYIPGVYNDWGGKRTIEHYTSTDLFHWEHIGGEDFGTGKVIDACIFRLPNGVWRMWYKDETNHEDSICYADSPDLYNWERRGICVNDVKQEGPNVFEFGGKYWMITDPWRGLNVYVSDDLEHFTRQEERILLGAGNRPTDISNGDHPDIYVTKGRAYILYFTFPNCNNPDTETHHVCVAQMAELKVVDGKLVCDRDAEFETDWV